jgi:hypothetical protein
MRTSVGRLGWSEPPAPRYRPQRWRAANRARQGRRAHLQRADAGKGSRLPSPAVLAIGVRHCPSITAIPILPCIALDNGDFGTPAEAQCPGSGSFFVEKSFKQLVRDMLDWGARLERVSLHPVMDSFLYAY